MTRRYYSSRKKPGGLTLEELYSKLQNLYVLLRDKDYFKGNAGITKTDLPDAIKHEAAIALSFQLFPITEWSEQDRTEDHVFDALEFLYDHVSKPGVLVPMTSEGWDYYDYDGYDDKGGRGRHRSDARYGRPSAYPGRRNHLL